MSIPYGYYIAPNGHVAIDQEKANIVRMIYQQYLFGMSLDGIADFLLKKDIPSPKGRSRWTQPVLSNLLSNQKYIGYIVSFDDFFLVQKVSPRGEWDGFGLYPNSDLVAVSQDAEYLGMLVRLLERKNQTPPPVPKLAETGLKTVLMHGMEHNRMVGLELYKSGNQDVVGYVLAQSNLCVCLRQVGPFGEADGVCYVKTSAITRVYLEDGDLLCLELLSQDADGSASGT